MRCRRREGRLAWIAGWALMAAVVATVLAGCACSGRPSDGGFLCGVRGIAHDYGARQDQLDQKRADAAKEYGALEDKSRDLSEQRAQTAAELQALQGEIRALDRDLARSDAQLRAAEKAGSLDAARLAQANAQLEVLKTDVAALKKKQASATPDEIAAIRKRQQKLALMLEE